MQSARSVAYRYLFEMPRSRTLLSAAGPFAVILILVVVIWSGGKPQKSKSGGDPAAPARREAAPPRAHRLDISTLSPGGTLPGWRASQGNFRLIALEGATALELPPEPMAEGQLVWNTLMAGGGTVSARMWGERKRRVAPRFAVGLVASGPYWLRAIPLEKKLELVAAGEVSLASVAWEWESERKVRLELRSSPASEAEDEMKTTLEGRVWHEGEDRPDAPSLSVGVAEEFGFVRAVAAAAPYALEPVYIDFIEAASR